MGRGTGAVVVMDRIKFLHGGNIELNGERMTVSKDYELHLGIPPQEIVEEGITEIEYAASSQYNRSLKPNDGKVKWFKDELGQMWFKLYVDHFNSDNRVYRTDCMVLPASRLVFVRYNS